MQTDWQCRHCQSAATFFSPVLMKRACQREVGEEGEEGEECEEGEEVEEGGAASETVAPMASRWGLVRAEDSRLEGPRPRGLLQSSLAH